MNQAGRRSTGVDFSRIGAALSARVGARLAPAPAGAVHGGCISESWRWESDQGPLFVKLGKADRLSMFEAEAQGLEALRGAQAVRVPRVLAAGAEAGAAYLALEWIEWARATPAAQAQLGQQLARQHRQCARAYGWHRDNTLGRTAQPNGWAEDWVSFWRERRLRWQLDLAHRHGYGGRLQREGAALLEQIDAFFTTHQPAPSLLHGDLWGGNWGVDAHGQPVIFDPAVYYGDRETDLAMTRLFGGFSREFYAAYAAEWPLEAGAPERVALYNLYHVLNHLNLFGTGYLGQAEALIEELLSRLR